MSDLVIRGGLVVDGDGSPARPGDVAIEAGRIAEIGAGLRPASRTLDARGMLVTPGFIDIHTHDDFTLPLRPEAEARVRQGITTTVTGNCGFSPFPLDDSPRSRRHGAFFEPALHDRWSDLAAFAGDLKALGLGVNVAPLVGLGAIRLAVMGEADSSPTEAEIVEMRRLVRQALDQGALGASSGLVYAPGCYAGSEELTALAEEVRAGGGFYATHIRNEASAVEGSVAESIETGRQAACPVHISHHKAIGRANWGKVERTLAAIDAARAEGLDVTLDVYPYVAGSSTLLSLIPAEHQVGGIDRLRGRIADPSGRAAVLEAIADERVFALSDVVLALVPSCPRLDGMRLADAAAQAGIPMAELVLNLIADDGESVVMIGFGMDEADVERVMMHPQAMVGSDGWVQALDASPRPHPRNFSTTARFLTRFVRDRPLIGLEAAIRKLTSQPADRLGLADRGRLTVGAAADLAVIDYESLRDLATYEEPCRYPAGVEHVIVNGVAVLQSGQLTGERAGAFLARA